MISRTLSSTEENYATNEREMLAIVWSLQKLRNYLYGVRNLHIFTDHQPLSYSISEKNPNPKIRRWRAFIEEFSPKFFYKPGKENVVADALSRQHLHHLDSDLESSGVDTTGGEDGSETETATEGTVDTRTASESMSTIHSEVSSTDVIRTVQNPVNCFRNQIILNESSFPGLKTKTIFGAQKRHSIDFTNPLEAVELIGRVVNCQGVNCILCSDHTLAQVQNKLKEAFPAVKFVRSRSLVIDVHNVDDQLEIIHNEHSRAHRSLKENMQQILSDYYFPNMRNQLKHIISSCRVCQEAKYSRHPRKHQISETPVPTCIGEVLHVDIYNTDK